MMKVMVVDNDRWVLSGITHLLESSDIELDLHCFDNAADALAFAFKHKPPLVVADVEMPGCDGLEMCNRLKKEYDPKLIIISGYDRFQYAQQAITLGVVQYVLKPIRQDEFLNVIRNVMDMIRTEDQSKSRQAQILKAKFFLDIASGRMDTVAVNEYKQFIAPMSKSRPVSLCLLHIENHAILINMIQQQTQPDHSQNIIEEALERCPESVISYEIRKGYFLFMIFGELNPFVEWMNTVFRLAKKNNCIASAGVSKQTRNLSQLGELYQQAVRALQNEFSEGSGRIYYYNKHKPQPLSPHKFDLVTLQNYSVQITNAMSSSNSFTCPNEAIDNLFDYLHDSRMEQSDACLFCRELLLLVSMEFMYMMENKPAASHPVHEVNLDSCRTLGDLKARFEASIEELYESIHQRAKSKSDSVKYVVDNMLQTDCSSVCLDAVAERLNVHPTYLSILFKDNVGTNFKDYVLEYKIKMAKRMLLTSDAPIYSISDQLGYMDATHFSRVFKKQTGMTPGEYRQSPKKSPPGENVQ